MIFIHASFTLEGKTAGQVIHAALVPDCIHASNTSFTPDGKTAGQVIHAVNHVIHVPGIHESHHPFRGGDSHANDRQTGTERNAHR
jgi:hypothetical protein